jgi:hypothetical protein
VKLQREAEEIQRKSDEAQRKAEEDAKRLGPSPDGSPAGLAPPPLTR